VGKGKPVAAVVEAVLNGAALRVLLLDSMQTFTVAVCGVACASMSKRAAPEGAPESDAAAATVVGQPEPYAREAKSFTEMRALNRWVLGQGSRCW
jgi:staphylococcal nuclease domain-containing protein 1